MVSDEGLPDSRRPLSVATERTGVAVGEQQQADGSQTLQNRRFGPRKRPPMAEIRCEQDGRQGGYVEQIARDGQRNRFRTLSSTGGAPKKVAFPLRVACPSGRGRAKRGRARLEYPTREIWVRSPHQNPVQHWRGSEKGCVSASGAPCSDPIPWPMARHGQHWPDRRPRPEIQSPQGVSGMAKPLAHLLERQIRRHGQAWPGGGPGMARRVRREPRQAIRASRPRRCLAWPGRQAWPSLAVTGSHIHRGVPPFCAAVFPSKRHGPKRGWFHTSPGRCPAAQRFQPVAAVPVSLASSAVGIAPSGIAAGGVGSVAAGAAARPAAGGGGVMAGRASNRLTRASNTSRRAARS